MRKINWKVRVKNPRFWVTLIPTVILLIQAVAYVFGFKLDLSMLADKLIAVVDSLFAVLAILGVTNDPTTDGFSDSERALSYEKPAKKNEEDK